MSRVLVTGATGFLGRALTRRLVARGDEPIGLGSADGDVAEPATLERVPPVDRVVHLAGRTFVPDAWADPRPFFRVNVQGTANVLELCRRRGVPLVHLSAYVYGQPARLPIGEADEPRPSNPYALSKLLAEQLCRFYAEVLSVPVTVLRPFNVFGPGQAAHFLVPKLVDQVLHAREIAVEDLAPRRDYVYVEDLVDAVVAALDRPGGFALYNVGSGRSMSVAEIVAAVQEAAGTRKVVRSAERVRPNELADVVADVSRIERELGWRPRFTFAKGIEVMLAAGRR